MSYAQEPPTAGWLHKDNRRVAPTPTGATMESPGDGHLKRRGMARVCCIGHHHEKVKCLAKLFMIVAGGAALAVGVTLIVFGSPSDLKGLYVMGSISIVFAVGSLLSCFCCTVRDGVAWQLKSEHEYSHVRRERSLSSEPGVYVASHPPRRSATEEPRHLYFITPSEGAHSETSVSGVAWEAIPRGVVTPPVSAANIRVTPPPLETDPMYEEGAMA